MWASIVKVNLDRSFALLGKGISEDELFATRLKGVEGALTQLADIWYHIRKRVNFTSHRTREGISEDLVGDSVFVFAAMIRTVKALGYKAKEGLRIVDVGTGGGVPGIPLLLGLLFLKDLIFPDLKILLTLIDRRERMIRVVNEVLDELREYLPISRFDGIELEVKCVDLRELERGYDIALARAVAPLPKLLKQIRKVLADGGVLLWQFSDSWQDVLGAPSTEKALKRYGFKVLSDEVVTYRLYPSERVRVVVPLMRLKYPDK